MEENTLKQIFPFVDSLSSESVITLNQEVKKLNFKKDDVIIRKGQKVGGVYLVCSGRLRIFSMDSKGVEKPIYSLDAGEICIFSINCILKKILYPAWVTVDSAKAEVISIPTIIFRNLYDNEPSVRDYVTDALSLRIFDLMSRIEDVTVFDLGARINSFLVRSCNEGGIIQMSHQEIANRLGTAREVVSRHLKHLEKCGYITLSRMRVEVLLPQELAKISSHEAV